MSNTIITYAPIDPQTGEAYVVADAPIQAVVTITRLDPTGPTSWDGAEWGALGTQLNMTSDGAFAWYYDAPTLTDGETYRIQCSMDGADATELDVIGTGAELANMFSGTTTAQMSTTAELETIPAGPTQIAYASAADYASYMAVDPSSLSSDISRMLMRASELVDEYTLGNVVLTNPKHVHGARMATCAQVEYWLTRGEDRDIDGPVEEYAADSVRMTYGSGRDRVSPTYLCPRAARFLRRAGLLYRGCQTRRAGVAGRRTGLDVLGSAN